jgi:hypothetical protein
MRELIEQNWKWVEQGVLNYPWDAALQSNKEGDVTLQLDHKQPYQTYGREGCLLVVIEIANFELYKQ